MAGGATSAPARAAAREVARSQRAAASAWPCAGRRAARGTGKVRRIRSSGWGGFADGTCGVKVAEGEGAGQAVWDPSRRFAETDEGRKVPPLERGHRPARWSRSIEYPDRLALSIRATDSRYRLALRRTILFALRAPVGSMPSTREN